ncbi:duplicated orphan permease [Dyadobacter koreensis]|uniref:Duplicated orphan permease n=1 Tax=Dyadobacter koreensis TaxID=408657 RepID=A0A1H6WTI1_9BACT|nr:ABC transporter permease [Dyadobacter koreensis]SEJ20259.1 duplicated orphan permease [Dyadobacter koreensis]
MDSRKDKGPLPPCWAEWLIGRITAPHIREEVLGDLYELFQSRVRSHGSTKAGLFYVLEMLLLLHPRLWRSPAHSTQLSNQFTFDSPSNPTAMFSNYFKVALRKLSRHKSYTVINVVSLSLGIACAILIFTLVKYHLSFDHFHANEDRIYRIYTELHKEKVTYSTGVPNPMGEAFRSGYSVAEKVGRIAFVNKRVVSLSPEKKFEEDLAFADPEFLDIFDFPLIEGSSQTALQEPNTALITDRIAKKYFGNQDPIGQLLHIDESLVVRITGVLRNLPATTDFRSEIYLPFASLKDHSPWMVEKDWWLGYNKEMQCFVRLKPGVSADMVDSKILRDIADKHYDKEMAKQFHFKLQPLSDVHFNPKLRGYTEKKNLWTFALIGLFLVATACVNFINLATAQALGRAREIGVRKVLGSQRAALFWQFITETGIITALALLIALGLTYLALPFINNWFSIALIVNPLTDTYLLAFLLGILLIVIFCSGAYPGLILARFQPVLALKGKLSQRSVGGFSLRKGLVVGQFAISQLLIIGTLIVTNQLRYSQQADMGFQKDAMIILSVPNNQKAKTNSLAAQLSEMAGVENVTFFDSPPATETIGSTPIQFDSRPEAEKFNISLKSADHNYIPTFKISVLAGRNLNPSDTVREYVLNEAAVKALGLASTQEVIGKTATINNRKGTIVGVIKDFHFKSFRTTIEPLCLTTWGEVYNSCAVNVNTANLEPILAGFRKAWTATYPSSVFTYRFMDEDIERLYKLDNMLLRLIQAFAGIAIFVGCLGLYGLVSFMAAQKTKEIGVRKVLDATTTNILFSFGKEFLRLLLIAFVLAAPLAWWVMENWLNNFAYRIELGAGIFLLAILITFIVALITVGFRSVKASLANPIKSLRME